MRGKYIEEHERIYHTTLYGVYTGTRSRVTAAANKQEQHCKILRTADGVTHWICVVQHTKRWLRYVLCHDAKEYTIVADNVEVLDTGVVTCLTCVRLGPGYPEEGVI